VKRYMPSTCGGDWVAHRKINYAREGKDLTSRLILMSQIPYSDVALMARVLRNTLKVMVVVPMDWLRLIL